MSSITAGKAWFTPVLVMVRRDIIYQEGMVYTHLIITIVRRNIQF